MVGNNDDMEQGYAQYSQHIIFVLLEVKLCSPDLPQSKLVAPTSSVPVICKRLDCSYRLPCLKIRRYPMSPRGAISTAPGLGGPKHKELSREVMSEGGKVE